MGLKNFTFFALKDGQYIEGQSHELESIIGARRHSVSTAAKQGKLLKGWKIAKKWVYLYDLYDVKNEEYVVRDAKTLLEIDEKTFHGWGWSAHRFKCWKVTRKIHYTDEYKQYIGKDLPDEVTEW